MHLLAARRLAIGLAILLAGLDLSAASALAGGASFPPPPKPRNPAALGANIQRTMTLLATSTPEHRNRVRILFYGQSITEQSLWREVIADLRRRFPNADIEAENRAIGGFGSAILGRPAEHDVFAYYPDLIVFHVYGDHRRYEEIIREMRSRTAAEILIQNDHLCSWPPKTFDKYKDRMSWWDHWMNGEFLPSIAERYGCGLLDVRSGWADYLKANRLQPRDLLVDDVHMNPQGKYLLAELTKAYFVYRPGDPADAWRALAKTYVVGQDVSWKEGRLTLAFEGNRIDLLAARSSGPRGKAQVRIDGKRPSEFQGAYAITRPKPDPWSPLALIRVDHEKPLIVEDWTLTVTSVSGTPARWRFEVAGSKTGPDGAGDGASTFVSKSGRVRIEPDSWHPKKPFGPGYRITWSVRPMFTDVYSPPAVEDPAREYATTLVQGIPDGPHTLELVAEPGPEPAIRAIRAYNPPYAPSLLVLAPPAAMLAVAVALLVVVRARRSGRSVAVSGRA